jgi:hypothetical protein
VILCVVFPIGGGEMQQRRTMLTPLVKVNAIKSPITKYCGPIYPMFTLSRQLSSFQTLLTRATLIVERF